METESSNFQTRQHEQAQMRRTRLLWAVAILLVASVIGIAWIGTTLTTDHDGSQNRLPGTQAESFVVRLKSTEEKLNALSRDRMSLTERIAQVEKSANSNVRRARGEAGALIEGVKRDMARNFEAVQSRLSGIESTQLEKHDEIARLREELADLRQDLAAIRQASDAGPPEAEIRPRPLAAPPED
jgi:prefoldin subunit 5